MSGANNISYGIMPLKKGQRRATMSEAVEARQVRYWGLKKVDRIQVEKIIRKKNKKKDDDTFRSEQEQYARLSGRFFGMKNKIRKLDQEYDEEGTTKSRRWEIDDEIEDLKNKMSSMLPTLNYLKRKLETEEEELGGGDIIGSIKGIYKALIGTRDNLKPSVRAVLETDGSIPMSKLYVVRRPLGNTYSTVLNVLNKIDGKSEVHDKLYHLFFVVELSNGKVYRLEKNEDINIVPYQKSALPEDMIEISSFPKIGLAEWLNKAISTMGSKNFYHYDAFTTNCQHFVVGMLNAIGINPSPEQVKFIVQDVSKLAPSWGKKLTGFLTSLKNRLNMARQGYGEEMTFGNPNL